MDTNDGLLAAWQIFLFSALLGAIGSAAALLRSSAPLVWRVVVATILTGGTCGLTIALFGLTLLPTRDSVWILLGAASVSGMAGNPTIMLLTAFVRGKASLELRFRQPDSDKPCSKKQDNVPTDLQD